MCQHIHTHTDNIRSNNITPFGQTINASHDETNKHSYQAYDFIDYISCVSSTHFNLLSCDQMNELVIEKHYLFVVHKLSILGLCHK